MIDIADIGSIPFIKVLTLMDKAGVSGNKYAQRVARKNGFLKVHESQSIEQTLAEYGLSYDRSKNMHFENFVNSTN